MKGIIMSGNHPKLILDGTKTMTRRVVKDPRRKRWSSYNPISSIGIGGIYSMGDTAREIALTKDVAPNFPCPYGQVGDRHFTYFKDSAPSSDGYYEVRWEAGDTPRLVSLRRHNEPDLPTDIPTEHEWERWLWGKDEHDDPEAISLDIRRPELIQWRRVGSRLWARETWGAQFLYDDYPPRDIPEDSVIFYQVNDRLKLEIAKEHRDLGKWRPSIHMPRWASRITLEITEVRVERLQEITEEDAIAEGFRTIAELIKTVLHLNHLPEDADPWVWVISFKVIK